MNHALNFNLAVKKGPKKKKKLFFINGQITFPMAFLFPSATSTTEDKFTFADLNLGNERVSIRGRTGRTPFTAVHAGGRQ